MHFLWYFCHFIQIIVQLERGYEKWTFFSAAQYADNIMYTHTSTVGQHNDMTHLHR